jgi:hypothetical protein
VRGVAQGQCEGEGVVPTIAKVCSNICYSRNTHTLHVLLTSYELAML